MTANTQHQPGIRELSASDIELVSGGTGGLKQLNNISNAQSGGRDVDVERRFQTDISSSHDKTLKALVANIRG